MIESKSVKQKYNYVKMKMIVLIQEAENITHPHTPIHAYTRTKTHRHTLTHTYTRIHTPIEKKNMKNETVFHPYFDQ